LNICDQRFYLVKNYKRGKFVVDSITGGLYSTTGLAVFDYWSGIVHINLMELTRFRRLLYQRIGVEHIRLPG
jgi:hypothetical protein